MSEHTAEEDAPEYVFTFDVIASDREGYYFDRWDRACRYEVIGKSKQHALNALWPLVGDAPRGRFWKARQVGAATDVRLRPASVTPSGEGRA
jgi:hypothetical protein